MKKFNNISSIHGGQTNGALSGSVFGMAALWLLICQKESGEMPRTGDMVGPFALIGSLVTCAALPALADKFKEIDNSVISFAQSFFKSNNAESN